MWPSWCVCGWPGEGMWSARLQPTRGSFLSGGTEVLQAACESSQTPPMLSALISQPKHHTSLSNFPQRKYFLISLGLAQNINICWTAHFLSGKIFQKSTYYGFFQRICSQLKAEAFFLWGWAIIGHGSPKFPPANNKKLRPVLKKQKKNYSEVVHFLSSPWRQYEELAQHAKLSPENLSVSNQD